MKRYMTTKEKAKQVGISHQALEKAIKSGRIEVSAVIGRVKGFESDNQLKPSKKKEHKNKG